MLSGLLVILDVSDWPLSGGRPVPHSVVVFAQCINHSGRHGPGPHTPEPDAHCAEAEQFPGLFR